MPVVVVGGVTVGGTGKTPIVIALVNELTERGFNPGVLSRGYKAKCDVFPSQVPMDCDPEIFGDEPSLIRRSTGVPVVIDPVRTRGADYLAGLGVDVIITDDGLQHYALDREVEICVLDGTRMLGNGCLLPAGPLREGEWRLSAVNSIVVSGAVAHLGHNPMMLRPSAITALNPDNPKQLEERGEVTAFCGIGNPSRFYKTLEDCGFVVVKKVEVGDHNKMPFDKLRELASERTVIMTAKDAIKYRKEAKESSLDNVFVLNVAAQLSKHFFDDIVSKIKLSLHRVEHRRRRREEAGYVLQKVEGIEDYGIKADADYITKTAARLSAEMQNAELAKSRLKAALRADKEGPVLPADDIEINPELNIDFSKQVSKDDEPPRQMEFEHQARADFVKRETVVVDAYRPGIGKSSSSKLDSKRDDDLDDQFNTKHDDQIQENAVASKHTDNVIATKHDDNAIAAKHTDNAVDSKQDESVEATKHDDHIQENVVDTKSDANHADDQVDAINANDAIDSHQITDETDVAKSDTCEANAKPSDVVESVEPKQDMYGPAAELMEKAAKFYEHAETLRNIAEQAQDQEAATDTHKSEDQSVELTEANADEISAVATADEQNTNSTNAAQEEQPQATAQDLMEESATANEDASYIAPLWVPYIPKAISNYSAAANVDNEAIEKTIAKQETVDAKSEPKVEADKSKITATAEMAKSDSVASEETAEVKVEPVVYDLWIPSIPSLFTLQESRSTVVFESKQEAQDLKQIDTVAAEIKSAKDQDEATSKSVATAPALQDQASDDSLAKDAAAQDKSAKDSESKDAEAKSEAETDVQVVKEYKLWIPSIPVLPSYHATAALEASQTATTTATTTTKSKSTAKKATTKASAADTAAKASTTKASAADTAAKASKAKASTAKASSSGSVVKTSPGEAIAAAKGTTKKTATKSAASDGSAVSKTTTRRAPTRAVIASIDELPKSIRKKTTKATKDAAKSETVLPLIDALDKSESTDALNTLVVAAKKDDAISAVETTKITTRTRKKASESKATDKTEITESKATDKSETTEAEASTAIRKSTAKKTTTKSTSTTKSTTTRKRTSTAAKTKDAEDATELSEDKVEVATSSKTTTKAKSTTAKATKKNSKADSASDAEVTTKKSAKTSAAAEGAADSEASTKKTTKASAKADAAKAESAKENSDKAESASESESSTKSTAKRTVKRTTRSSAKDEKDIFALKKMRDVYDPNAVPTKLKRKTTTKSKSAE